MFHRGPKPGNSHTNQEKGDSQLPPWIENTFLFIIIYQGIFKTAPILGFSLKKTQKKSPHHTHIVNRYHCLEQNQKFLEQNS